MRKMKYDYYACMELSWNDQLKFHPFWVLLLSSFGFLSISKCFLSFLKWVFITFLRPPKNLNNYGSWALITGPTDGIGKAFALQLAQKGLNLILVGRNPNKLKTVSDAVRTEFKTTQIKKVVVDFAGDVSDGIQRIQKEIEGLEVGILINNAGATYPNATFFHEVDEDVWKGLIKINVESMLKITKVVLPGMLQRKKGAIVNIGSAASVVIPSHPLYAIYAATKGFVDQFSRSIYVEYKKSGIDVQCQVPLYVATKMVSFKRSSFFVPSPDAYARAAIRWIGYEPLCTPYWRHSLQWCLVSLLPETAISEWRLQHGIRMRGDLKASK
ncbi:very-long-chain 3-oxoacyl-CoA reductase 1-like [Magnolia sinica]|uniref:very-long-chain 3-oxoacyl-CoA reductase 1-like n=1 Tax=Magnolia sinica TaxID=86752 RepID=UPI0026590692|nr:very-long-chain 3-oxoacyl-CoA reductase 1-like [Magnolia sinica]